MAADNVDLVFRAFDLTGVAANAVIGGVVAREEHLDPVGFAVLAVLTGLGGGLIRDVLLQHGPPVALVEPSYLVTALAGACISYVVHIRGRMWDRAWSVVDAVALGCWAVTGSQKALVVGLGWLPAILLGIITAVGGGAARDIVLRRVPGVLGGNTLYATAAGAGAATFVLLASQTKAVAQFGALAVGAGLCLVARRRGWILPSADAWSRSRVLEAPRRAGGQLRKVAGRGRAVLPAHRLRRRR